MQGYSPPLHSPPPPQHSCFLTGFFSYRSDEMPRASRIQSEARRQLLEASKANGQTKFSSFTQSVVLDDDFECTTNEDGCEDAIQSETSASTHQSGDKADNP